MEGKGEIRLALSENHNWFSKEIVDELRDAMEFVNMYPEPGCLELRNELAKIYGLSEKNYYVGNGLDEIILSVLLGLNVIGKKIMVSKNTFKGYYYSAKLLNNLIVEIQNKDFRVDVDTMLERVFLEHVDLVYLCNPHNPLGTIVKKEKVLELATACKNVGTYLAVDEAYLEFLEETSDVDVMDVVKENDMLMVLRTFSKAYGLAGLRCGFVFAQENITKKLYSVKEALPFSVNSFAQRAAIVALRDKDRLNRICGLNKDNLQWTESKLAELGIPFIKSFTNFVSIKMESPNAFCEYLRKKYSIYIKNLDSMGMAGWLRISIGTREQMELIIHAITEYVEK